MKKISSKKQDGEMQMTAKTSPIQHQLRQPANNKVTVKAQNFPPNQRL